MKNLKLIIATVVLSITTNLFAQTEKTTPTKVPDMLQNADYVFEGTVVDAKGYWTKLENGNDNIYTSLLVEVTNVFKGNGIKLGLIQIIVRGGEAQIPNGDQISIIPYNQTDGDERIIITNNGVKGIFEGKIIPNNVG